MIASKKTSNTHINDSAHCSNSIWTVNDLEVWLHVLHDTRRDHKHILGDLGEFFDDKVDHLSQGRLYQMASKHKQRCYQHSPMSSVRCLLESTHILVLEQLGDTKEQGSSFLRSETLSNIEQVDDLGKEYTTFPRTYWGFVEDARFLNDGRLVLEEDADCST